MNPAKDGPRPRRSSCLLFQMFGVETHSFLPNDQSDGRDLACQGEARQIAGFIASGDAGLRRSPGKVPRSAGGSRRCTLEDIFQIVIMVAVEPANGQNFLGAFQLASDEAVFPAGVRLQRQTAVGPQLSLGPEAIGASASERSTKRRGWGRSRESAAVISWPDVSGLPLTVLAALAGATAAKASNCW